MSDDRFTIGHGSTFVPVREIFPSKSPREFIVGKIEPPHVEGDCPKCDSRFHLELAEGYKAGEYPMVFYGVCPGCKHRLRVTATIDNDSNP